jgi:hypothetical protein
MSNNDEIEVNSASQGQDNFENVAAEVTVAANSS